MIHEKDNSGEVRTETDSADFINEVLNDYRIVCESRNASLLGRKEVLTGKAKFGIFGDGKEVAQIAMAKAFREGDFRSGYYRDQTFMFAIGALTLHEWFAGLYGNTDDNADPMSHGRQMGGHYATKSLNEDGSWKDLTQIKNSSADLSPTASQMARLVGLALASKLYRQNKDLHQFTDFSNKGNEVAFGTIGDASTSEGIFFEAINAAGVLQIPMAVSIWDDGYGISVPSKYQTTKQNISEILRGFARNENEEGYIILRCKGWDYVGLCEMYAKGIAECRAQHVPVLFHIQEMTQPQGHSTSGSHERYKSKERLVWETENDCILKMREWMISTGIATGEECDRIEAKAKADVNEAKKFAWEASQKPVKNEIAEVSGFFDRLAATITNTELHEQISKLKAEMNAVIDSGRKDIVAAVKKLLRLTNYENNDVLNEMQNWLNEYNKSNQHRYSSYLYSHSDQSALKIEPVAVQYADGASLVDGREIIQANFDALFANDPRLVAFGEDLGKIGDVNQGFASLQAKYGEIRITDTGIREATIIGQGIGLALRGLRPIAEIQYLDYLLYALQILSDDLSTLQYRTKGGQKAPVIIRTRGHRLEGIWHSGSPMGMIINSLRGIHILVPRNMTQAAGFYNTMLASDEPALIIECLNGYRLKEKLPSNPGIFKIPLGIPKILQEGNDVTIVTYGSCCRIAIDAIQQLKQADIHCELIDVQTLLPFDIHHSIVESLKKTNKLLILDEDVPGGASAYILQKILEEQKAFQYLDSAPRTVTAQAHRPAYGSDGDYFSKPNAENVFDTIYEMMSEYDPAGFPALY